MSCTEKNIALPGYVHDSMRSCVSMLTQMLVTIPCTACAWRSRMLDTRAVQAWRIKSCGKEGSSNACAAQGMGMNVVALSSRHTRAEPRI